MPDSEAEESLLRSRIREAGATVQLHNWDDRRLWAADVMRAGEEGMVGSTEPFKSKNAALRAAAKIAERTAPAV